MGWNGEVVHTRRVGTFSNRNDAERCVDDLNRPRGDDCYYIYSIELQPVPRGNSSARFTNQEGMIGPWHSLLCG